MASILDIKNKLFFFFFFFFEKSQAEQRLPRVPVPDITLEHPQNPEHGDIATSLPLKLARAMGKNPMEIAGEITRALMPSPEFSKCAISAPGFINFSFSSKWLAEQIDLIISAQSDYGSISIGTAKKAQVEFVSVNPTGPLHVGHGRGAVLGSTLANVLEKCGYKVHREYYINDAGSQIDLFKHSLYARYKQHFGHGQQMPEGGYIGEYMIDLAEKIALEAGEKFLETNEAEAINQLGEIGLELMIQQIKTELKELKVEFDCWFSERTLYQEGYYHKSMELLKEGGHLAQKELATWFASTALGDNKDNVVVRSDGSPTYFAADIAYHYNKFIVRDFDWVVNIWGADHQGHVSRMKAVMSALKIDPDRLDIIISQMVTLKRGGDLVRVSKRSGELITLKEVVEEVGADACRYFFLSRSADSQMDFDLELAKKESAENPVYYIQYAHARIASILRLAKDENIDFADGNPLLLTEPAELALIKGMAELPEVIELVTKTLEPHHLAYYSQKLATLFHSFYKQCRVVQKDDLELTRARIKLVIAAKIVFASALELMGMTIPDSM